MKNETCEHDGIRPVAYSDGQYFMEDEELSSTPFVVMFCSDCDEYTFGWLSEINS